MRLLPRTNYALKLLLCLCESKTYCNIAQIAREAQLPNPYLQRIVLLLAKAGLIETRRGTDGGCRLKKEPWSISLYDVLNATNRKYLHSCHSLSTCDTPNDIDVFINKMIEDQVISTLRQVTLDMLRNRMDTDAPLQSNLNPIIVFQEDGSAPEEQNFDYIRILDRQVLILSGTQKLQEGIGL